MPTQRVLDELIEMLRAATSHALPEPIPTHLSLTDSLGLDSMVLTDLFAAIRARFGPVELTAWFVASRGGGDTLASLAGWLAAATQPVEDAPAIRYRPTATRPRGSAARR